MKLKHILLFCDIIIVALGLYGIATAKNSQETGTICILMLLALKCGR